MYKKAGIILGIVCFVVSAVLYWVFEIRPEAETAKTVSASSVTSSKPAETKKPANETLPTPSVTPSAPEVTPNTTPVTPSNTQIPALKEGAVTTEGTLSKQVFSSFSDKDLIRELGKPLTVDKELMVVSKKKVVLLDGDATQGSTLNKQLVYAVDLLGADNNRVLTLYLNGVSYEAIAVGERLDVEYALYKNDNGVSFPVILNVEK